MLINPYETNEPNAYNQYAARKPPYAQVPRTDGAPDPKAIERRKLIAEAMLKNAITPIVPEAVGGMTANVHPLQGLGQMANAYAANKRLENPGGKGLFELGMNKVFKNGN